MATRIGLTGDVMLGRNVDRRQRSPLPAVWGDLRDRLSALDHTGVADSLDRAGESLVLSP